MSFWIWEVRENTVLARRIRDLGVYSEIHPHDITVEELKALDNVKGIILNGGGKQNCGRQRCGSPAGAV